MFGQHSARWCVMRHLADFCRLILRALNKCSDTGPEENLHSSYSSSDEIQGLTQRGLRSLGNASVVRRQDFSSLWNLRQDKHSGHGSVMKRLASRVGCIVHSVSAVSLLNKKMWKRWWRHTRARRERKACRTHGSNFVTYFSRWHNIQWISVLSHYGKLSWFMWGLVGNVINWLHNCANNLQFTATNKHRGRKTQSESDYHLRTETHSPFRCLSSHFPLQSLRCLSPPREPELGFCVTSWHLHPGTRLGSRNLNPR